MNDTKKVMCHILKELKEDNGWTYSYIIDNQKGVGGSSVTPKQLTSIFKHSGSGVSVSLIDEILFNLGYETEVHLTTRKGI